MRDGLSGYINLLGAEVIAPRFFDDSDSFTASGYARVQTKSGFGVVDRNGVLVIAPTYQSIEWLEDQMRQARAMMFAAAVGELNGYPTAQCKAGLYWRYGKSGPVASSVGFQRQFAADVCGAPCRTAITRLALIQAPTVGPFDVLQRFVLVATFTRRSCATACRNGFRYASPVTPIPRSRKRC